MIQTEKKESYLGTVEIVVQASSEQDAKKKAAQDIVSIGSNDLHVKVRKIGPTPSVRINFECISWKDVPIGVESFADGETFVEAVEDLIRCINLNNENHQPSGEWGVPYYYTNEDDGYYFYRQEDLKPIEGEEA